jgi:hypothetical protein
MKVHYFENLLHEASEILDKAVVNQVKPPVHVNYFLKLLKEQKFEVN